MDNNLIFAFTTIIFASTGFWAFITRLWELRRKKNSAESRAILALLHDKLFYLCAKQINEVGNITADELENLTCLYEPYREMGGNGTCEHLYNECKNLPKAKGR